MGVSSQTTPFNPSPHSFYWVSKDVTRSFPSIIPLPSRSCSHSSRATIYRQEIDILRGPYGPSPYNNLSLQLRMYRSTFHTKQRADASRFSYMSWSPPSKHPIQSEFGNPASSFGWNYSKVGQSLVAEEDVQESKDDHLSLDDPTISNSSSRPVVSDSERRDWSLARNIIKKSKIEVSKAFNGVSYCSKINSLRIGGAPPSQHMNVNYPVHGQTLGWPDEACNKDQAGSEKTQDATSKVMHVNGSLSSSSGNKSEKEKRGKQLSKVIPSYNVNEIDEEIVMDADQSCLEPMKDGEEQIICQQKLRTRLCSIYDKVLVVDKISSARNVVSKLMNQYRHLVHACDTEVSRIDVKQETPVDHGEITCFSIYSGEGVDFGNGKSCIWVDVLDGGGKDLFLEFAPFFADSSIKKVWHNYSFDSHIIENYGIKLSGFHADTMHMARLWNSSRRTEGGYSLEALTGDQKLMSRNKLQQDEDLFGKISMKIIFGRRKVKKDGSLGKIITIPPIEELQREDRKPWICYSSLDSISTFKLYESLKYELSTMPWKIDGTTNGYMLAFYANYWRPFGELLMQMETEGMLVDREYLREMENLATAEQQAAAGHFCNWASRYCPDARYMNPRSNTQLRHLFFGGIPNSKNPDECLPNEKTFRVPNVDKVIEEGKKSPTKFRNILLHKIGGTIKTDLYTATGWPSVSGDALRILAGKVSAEYYFGTDACDFESVDSSETVDEVFNTSGYGTAFAAFGEGREGIEACHAVAALCEVCSIDSLISNFILPLQGSHVAGKNGRVHCSLNINTETGRLSARRPNLQNQPALEKDRYKIRQAFIASPGKSLVVADYGQLELRILAHLADCKSMKEAFKAGGDFHSRTAMNMYPYISEAVKRKQVLLEWHPLPGQDKPPVPLLKDTFASERRKAKMLNFSIAYGKTPVGLARDWKVSVKEARETVDLWYKDRKEVRRWQEERKKEAVESSCVYTLLGRARRFPSITCATSQQQRGHIERAAINTPVQGSAADVAMCAMLKLSENKRLNELGWKLLLQVHDEVILEGPTESAEEAKSLVVKCMAKPFKGAHILDVDLVVDAKCAQNWYSAK